MMSFTEGSLGRRVVRIKHRVLIENRQALYFCNYKENKKMYMRMLDTLFIVYFIDIMKQYFHY